VEAGSWLVPVVVDDRNDRNFKLVSVYTNDIYWQVFIKCVQAKEVRSFSIVSIRLQIQVTEQVILTTST
jgi:hypothetical protein